MSERDRALVVEDDDALRDLLVTELSDRGLAARGAATAEAARELLEAGAADVVVTDIRLPGAGGIDLLRWGQALRDGPDFIMITAFGGVRQAVQCLQEGARDFLTKPLDLDHLAAAVDRVLELRRLHRQVARYQEVLGEAEFRGMVGRSPAMRALFERVRRVAGARGPVLVVGESGTGKELAARAIHAESDRAEAAFVAVNCAGIPEDLLESEFFGHTEGAFTGATQARAGLFEEADGGTLMLDEITEMPRGLQAKLLRVLQDGRVRPVGANREREVDVRIVAATNQDIRDAVDDGRFREDLYFRLATFTLEVPPLRDRGDDIDLLLAHYFELFALRDDHELEGFTPAAVRRIHRYPFPGNVRELRNVVERAVTFAAGPRVDVDALPERLREPVAADGAAAAGLPPDLVQGGDDMLPTLREVEDRYIRHVLDRVDGNKRRAAALLGIARRTLYRRLDDEVDQ